MRRSAKDWTRYSAVYPEKIVGPVDSSESELKKISIETFKSAFVHACIYIMNQIYDINLDQILYLNIEL